MNACYTLLELFADVYKNLIPKVSASYFPNYKKLPY